ncbi:FAD-dependent protein [uncultured Muribaculum sp.]|uniref:NAD(P)/FAD-dependent oxidoreductase n=1 Tax=uncultured Muribaculum sp. TaxID=1918613 RepID=UPI0025AFEAAF|nr:FAD-dependent monooxygenase [uncultured Muribaculum sp.]
MITILNLRVDPVTAATQNLLLQTSARQLKIEPGRIKELIITKRSIDARGRSVAVNLTLRIQTDTCEQIPLFNPVNYTTVPENAPQCIVVGAGPAGLFAALRLIQRGIRPVILERGKDVDQRRHDMAAISRQATVNPDSNYCFGEGGAGAFSDGKLYTRSKKRGPVEHVLQVLCQHGATEKILIDAHPHIGSDRLPVVIKNIRHTIERCGGRVLFGQRVTRLLTDNASKVVGVQTADNQEYSGPVIMATGHSARDVYEMLIEHGVTLEPKGIAVGCRLEHPQHLIDCIQYHSPKGRGQYLPPAEYSMLTRVRDRAVYSFCMCPGGIIIPAASAPGELVVNGMSPSNRGSRWANSGMVVEVLPEDIPVEPGKNPALRIMDFQHKIEKAFFTDSGTGTQNAPAQRMIDFVEGRISKTLPATSYAPGIHTAAIHKLLPKPIASRLQNALRTFGRNARGFLTNDATLIGCETRTSAPVRITRHSDILESISTMGLYPCGEGAGYAGGIVSAAIDGLRCADALADAVASKNQA